MVKEKVVGIYCIENLVNNKKYIGQSVDVESRFRKHKNTLVRNMHGNKHLQKSWNKYGEDAFEFYIVFKCDKEELNELEISEISKHRSTEQCFGYNLTSGGYAFTMSKSRLKQHTKTKQELEGKPILAIDCVYGDITEYPSRGQASRDLSISMRVISSALIKEKHTYSGSIWFYKNEYEKIKGDFDYREYMRKVLTAKPIVMISKDGVLIEEFLHGKDVENSGFNRVRVTNCCKGRRADYKGFIWKYKMDFVKPHHPV